MSQNKSLKKEKFSIDVLMDENLIPEDLQWNSPQGKGQSEKASQSALIYLWNAQKNETFSLDLWTKKMSIEEMNKMMFQTIMTLANSYEKATSEDQLANAMRDFGEFFGEKTEILPKSGKFDGNGKDKLKRFSQLKTFKNVIQPQTNYLSEDDPVKGNWYNIFGNRKPNNYRTWMQSRRIHYWFSKNFFQIPILLGLILKELDYGKGA